MTNVEPLYAGTALYARIVALAAALFVVATNGLVIAGLLLDIAHTLDVHVSDVGYAISFYAATVAIAAPATSILFSGVSRTRLMAIGMLLVALGTVVAALAPTLPIFIGGRVIAALGGAAVVPVATASAAAIAAPSHRGRAIGLVVIGFTAATAFGAPIGTALSALGGWRIPLFGLAGLSLLGALAIALAVRRVPLDPPVSLAHRFAVLGNGRLVLALLTTVFVVAGFNIVYIFSSAVVDDATGGDGSLFALLLLVYGVAGLIGNSLGGQLTDRIGPRRVSAIFITVMVLSLAAMPLVSSSLIELAATFAVWGFASSAALPAVQYRQITIDPTVAGVALSWNSTALYIGIAIAPFIGDLSLELGGPLVIPVVGALAAAIALALFQLSWAGRVSATAPPAKG